MTRLPTRVHVSPIEDSRRWRRFEPRPDDIFITTPPKSGTTWMQGIVSSLLWPEGGAPGTRFERSPWVDARFTPEDDMLASVEAISYRRFIKTHSPADCAPVFEQCRYVAVYRDGRDALMSWANHRSRMRPELLEYLNATAIEEGIEPIPPVWDGDMDSLFDEWEMRCSSITHLASWWPMRQEPFVTFVHYNDLVADLEGEMRRLAGYLGIEVPEELWPGAVERCGLAEMRADAAENSDMDLAFDGGAAAFFHKGTNGRWRGVLTEAQLARYDDLVATLAPEAAEWLEHGSLALERRP